MAESKAVKRPVKKAVKKRALGSVPSPVGVEKDWKAFARRLAVELGWSRKDLERVFGR
jgi:hypothetical protein